MFPRQIMFLGVILIFWMSNLGDQTKVYLMTSSMLIVFRFVLTDRSSLLQVTGGSREETLASVVFFSATMHRNVQLTLKNSTRQ